AGLCVALPALFIGLGQAAPLSGEESLHGTRAGSSILLALMYQIVHGGDLASAASATIRLTPVAYAGWIGLVVTALNLLPVGQLAGGHIAYGLFGRRYARASNEPPGRAGGFTVAGPSKGPYRDGERTSAPFDAHPYLRGPFTRSGCLSDASMGQHHEEPTA